MLIVKLCILSRSTADEEPLVNGSVDLRGGELLVRRQRRQRLSRDAAGRVLNSRVGARVEREELVTPTICCHMDNWDLNLRRDAARLGLAGNQALPGLSTLADDVHGVAVILLVESSSKTLPVKKGHIRLVLALASEGELVLGLAVRDLVDTEPLVGGTEKARQVALNVLDVVELRGQRVVHVNDNDLPVSLLLVEKGHDTEDLDLLDLAGVANKLADLADIERVVVTLGLGLGVNGVGVLPGLERTALSVVILVLEKRLAEGPELELGIEEMWHCIPGGRHRSSTGSPCGGSSCGQSEACPS